MKRICLLLMIIFSLQLLIAEILPPIAVEIPYQREIHGYTLTDEYHWLKDKSRSDPEVLKYLEQENKYTEMMMAGSQSLQDILYNEFRRRIPENDNSVPYKMGSYWYYNREEEGNQYPIFCRRKGDMFADEEIYLDQNELAKQKEYLNIINKKISSNENLLAYLADYDGSEVYTLYVKNLTTGELLPDSLAEVDDVCWANDNQTLFYCTADESGRTDKVWRHKLSNDFSEDEMIYYEPDESFYSYVYKSKSKKYIIIGTSSKTSSEIRILPADDSWREPQLIEPRRPGIEYYVTHHEDSFFINTNEDAPDFKLMTAPESAPQRENWQEYIPHRPSLTYSLEIYKDYLILRETKNYHDRIRVIELNTNEEYYINPPDSTARLYLNYLPEYDSQCFWYNVESMQTPGRKYEHNLITRKQKLLKEQIVLGFESGIYESQRLYATASDGEQIPISIVYNKNEFSRDSQHPLLLTAYGAYGDNSDPYFSTTKLSLLDRGFCWAIAHVRGGGEMGKRWYKAGKMKNKKNTFTDFITCTQYLIIHDYTSSQYLAIEGCSAGGLLVAAVNNMRPDLFKVVVGDVPFVDLINTMLDPSLSATVSEYEEWGNPNIKEEFEYMYSYCPYYNVKKQDYPNILLLAGFHDPRVNYWEPAKFCAKLRKYKTDDNLLLLKVNGAGHGGSSGRYEYLKEIAFEFAFIIDRIIRN